VKFTEVKTGCNLVETSKEGYGKKECFANDDDDDYRPIYLYYVTLLSPI
jgi:hypothetical protein